MEEITFLVQGSAPAPYTVQFRKNGSNLTALCTCPAGSVGQYCKHRISILDGNADGIVSENKNSVRKVEEWLRGTDVEIALSNVRAAEERMDNAKRELATFKKALAKALTS